MVSTEVPNKKQLNYYNYCCRDSRAYPFCIKQFIIPSRLPLVISNNTIIICVTFVTVVKRAGQSIDTQQKTNGSREKEVFVCVCV